MVSGGGWLVVVVFLVDCRGGDFVLVGGRQPNEGRVVVVALVVRCRCR